MFTSAYAFMTGLRKFYSFTFMVVEVVAFVESHLEGFTFKDLQSVLIFTQVFAISNYIRARTHKSRAHSLAHAKSIQPLDDISHKFNIRCTN